MEFSLIICEDESLINDKSLINKPQLFKQRIQDKTIQELKTLLNKCVEKERYEFCAVIRDRLEELNEKV